MLERFKRPQLLRGHDAQLFLHKPLRRRAKRGHGPVTQVPVHKRIHERVTRRQRAKPHLGDKSLLGLVWLLC